MNVTRNVVLDLLPLYLAGEASDDTRALVDHYLKEDPSLMRLARRAKKTGVPTDVPARPSQEVEMRSFLKTRLIMLRLHLFLALAVTFTVGLAGSMAFLLDTRPEAGAISFVLSAIFWVAYGITSFRASRIGS